MISFGRRWRLAGVAVLSSFLAVCGDKEDKEDKEEPFDCSTDYTMEQFWTDYYEIDCLYFATCVVGHVDSTEVEECVESRASGKIRNCDESEFNPCGSWACIEAWRAEVDILESDGRLGECPFYWNIPLYEECNDSARMQGDCGEVFDE